VRVLRLARALPVLLWMITLSAVASGTGVQPELALHAPGPHGQLGGIYLGVVDPHAPVALIIPDSGPLDHDGNNQRGLRADTYRLLARDLAAAGVGSLRIDKRGLYMSSRAIADANSVTIEDYVADVREWLKVLRTRTRRPCIWLIGHGEGGLVALVAAQQRTDVCGLVLLATAGRPLGEVLRDELARASPGGVLSHPVGATLDALEAGRHVEASALPRPVAARFRPELQGFLISAFAYHPDQLLKAYARPVLIVQGSRDLQVGEQDARLLAAAAPHARLVLLPDVNHVLKSVKSDSRAANLATYAAADLPLAADLVSAIAAFMQSN
jgi:uncharacterized protein